MVLRGVVRALISYQVVARAPQGIFSERGGRTGHGSKKWSTLARFDSKKSMGETTFFPSGVQFRVKNK